MALRVWCEPFERQSSKRMKASGETENHFCFLLFGWPNGYCPPATTRFDESTHGQALAKGVSTTTSIGMT